MWRAGQDRGAVAAFPQSHLRQPMREEIDERWQTEGAPRVVGEASGQTQLRPADHWLSADCRRCPVCS
eukprot:6572453-Pyramimonas_sp.AAC.1